MRYTIIINVEGEMKEHEAHSYKKWLFSRVNVMLAKLFRERNTVLHISVDDPADEESIVVEKWVFP